MRQYKVTIDTKKEFKNEFKSSTNEIFHSVFLCANNRVFSIDDKIIGETSSLYQVFEQILKNVELFNHSESKFYITTDSGRWVIQNNFNDVILHYLNIENETPKLWNFFINNFDLKLEKLKGELVD